MKVIIAQVHENLFDGEADELSVPTTDGAITVLSNHEPLVAVLKPGTATVKKSGEVVKRITVENGILEVSNGQATLLL